MVVLFDLANELLLQILDSLTPIDMVSFATSCKEINTLAQDNLILHRQRIQRYQNVTLWWCFRHQDRPHPILLLRDICNDWRVACYTKSLVIKCCGKHPIPSDETSMDPDWDGISQACLIAQDNETIKSVLPEISTTVCKMLRMTLRWHKAKINNALDMMENGARGAMLGLLIVLLPAIKSVSFNGYVWRDELWNDALKSIRDHQDPRPGRSEANFLMNVSELNIDGQYVGHPYMCCSIIPFMTLPALRVIRGASLKNNVFDDLRFSYHLRLPPSPVTEIDFQSSAVEAVRLGKILRYTQALKRFRYDQEGQLGVSNGAEPGRIINYLLAYASHSLKSLALTGANEYRSPNDDGFNASLQGFKVLKALHLPSNAFLTYTSRGKVRALRTEDVPRLVDILPTSIVTVRLDGEMTWEELAALLMGMSEYKTKCLPKLKSIEFTVKRDQEDLHKQDQAFNRLDQKQGMELQLDGATWNALSYSGCFVF